MVRNFRRSLSFPIPNSKPNWLKTKARASYVRSTSLPCGSFHPFISQLNDEIHALRTWQSQLPKPGSGSPSWIRDGLARLDHLHASLDELLQRPQALDSLRRGSDWTDRLLDDFLRFADAHGSFRSAIFTLKQHQWATQAAVRRKDEERIESCVRNQKKAEKELTKLAAAVRNVGRFGHVSTVMDDDVMEAELAGVVREVMMVTASASAAIFIGIAELSSGALGLVSSYSLRSYCMVSPLTWRKRKEEEEEEWRWRALERLEEVEECIGEVEGRSEQVFRSLVNGRVFLLNVQTPLSL